MKIGVIGIGYVGLVTSVCLANFGYSVICHDKDLDKLDSLKAGLSSIYEPGLDDILAKNLREGRLDFTHDVSELIEEAQVLYIAVGTPSDDNGEADISSVLDVADQIADYMDSHKVIVIKSTVPIGMGRRIRDIIDKRLDERESDISFDIVSNPEFLREGSAVYDFTHPDRIILGSDSSEAISLMKNLYRPLYLNKIPFVITDHETAEMIKYASNAFLAMKITYINEIANLCEKIGANGKKVAYGMGMDGRISSKFLHAGPGYGGSCFTKDTRALASIGQSVGSRVTLVEEVIRANEYQRYYMLAKINTYMDTRGKEIAVLGLSFKPRTDDIRESPALTIIRGLVKQGTLIRAFDPAATENTKAELEDISESIYYATDEYDAVMGSSGVILVTDWNQFRSLNLDKVYNLMNEKYFFDLRNLYERESMVNRGFTYIGVGQ